MATHRLDQQIAFLLECDRLKQVERRTLLTDGQRYENSAEHSWHIALMALFLSEYAAEPELDLLMVLQMLLLHDLVEIDAGDTYAYDEVGRRDQDQREQRAADRLFGMLPDDQGKALREIWDAFQAGDSPEARLAHALDRFQPVIHNVHTRGKTWQAHGIRRDQVLKRTAAVGRGAPALGRHVAELLDAAVRKGYLSP
jgi:putative hydrolase of HD superfamily